MPAVENENPVPSFGTRELNQALPCLRWHLFHFQAESEGRESAPANAHAHGFVTVTKMSCAKNPAGQGWVCLCCGGGLRRYALNLLSRSSVDAISSLTQSGTSATQLHVMQAVSTHAVHGRVSWRLTMPPPSVPQCSLAEANQIPAWPQPILPAHAPASQRAGQTTSVALGIPRHHGPAFARLTRKVISRN